MKAYSMDDEGTVYAANSKEEAIKLYERDYELTAGVDFLSADVVEVSDEELDRQVPDCDEYGAPTGLMTTMRTWLNESFSAGCLCGHE